MKTGFLITCLFVLTISACQQAMSFDLGDDVDYHVKKDIPERNLAPVLDRQWQSLINVMKIADLEKGVDSFQIRFWIEPDPFLDSLQLLSLKKSGGVWEGYFSNVRVRFDRNYKNARSQRNKTIEVTTTNWSKIEELIFDSAFLYRKDFSELPNYMNYSDGTAVGVEWATTKEYRYYASPNLDGNRALTKQLYEVLISLEKIFGIKFRESAL